MSDSDRPAVLLIVRGSGFRSRIRKSIDSIASRIDVAESIDDGLKLIRLRRYSLLIVDSSTADGLQHGKPQKMKLSAARVPVLYVSDTVDGGIGIDSLDPAHVTILKQPVSTERFQSVIRWLLMRPSAEAGWTRNYESLIRKARIAVSNHRFEDARQLCTQALNLDSTKADVHNLMGVLHEVSGNRLEAQEEYRMALELDPTYAPARANLHESVEPGTQVSFYLDEAKRVLLG